MFWKTMAFLGKAATFGILLGILISVTYIGWVSIFANNKEETTIVEFVYNVTYNNGDQERITIHRAVSQSHVNKHNNGNEIIFLTSEGCVLFNPSYTEPLEYLSCSVRKFELIRPTLK